MLNSFFLSRKRKKAADAARRFLETKVSALLTAEVVVTRPDVSVIQAATNMIAQDVSCIVVVAKEDRRRPIGIVTERDFLKKVPASSTALKKRVEDIMTPKVVTISADKTLREAHALMREHGFRKLIVAEDGVLRGILTQTDIVAHAVKCFRIFTGTKPCVCDWMTKNPITASPTTSFADAKKIMMKHDVGSLLIKGKDYEGIFTEYDVVAQFYDQGGMLQIKSPKDIMHPQIRCVRAAEGLLFTNRVMLEKKVRRMLVVDGVSVAGIITQTDMARALTQAAEEMLLPDQLAKFSVFEEQTKAPIEPRFVNGNLKVYELQN